MYIKAKGPSTKEADEFSYTIEKKKLTQKSDVFLNVLSQRYSNILFKTFHILTLCAFEKK